MKTLLVLFVLVSTLVCLYYWPSDGWSDEPPARPPFVPAGHAGPPTRF